MIRTPYQSTILTLTLGLTGTGAWAGSLETQSNEVSPGDILIGQLDTVNPNDRTDWDTIPSYQADPADDAPRGGSLLKNALRSAPAPGSPPWLGLLFLLLASHPRRPLIVGGDLDDVGYRSVGWRDGIQKPSGRT